MNLKINKIPAQNIVIHQPCLLMKIITNSSLVFYPNQPKLQKQEQVKKKFNFKANNNAAPQSEDIYILDIVSKQWKKQTTKGKFPSKRQKSTTTNIRQFIIIYGGKQSPQGKILNDLFCLNTETWEWKKLFTMQSPNPYLQSFIFTISNDKLLLVNNQIWIFHMKQINWKAESSDIPGGVWQKVQNTSININIKSSFLFNNKIYVICWQNGLRAFIYDIQSCVLKFTTISSSQINIKQQIRVTQYQNGYVIIIDKKYIFNLLIQKDKIIIGQMISELQFTISDILAFDYKDSITNVCLSSNQIYQIFIEPKIDQKLIIQQQQILNTARQLSQKSLIQKTNQLEQEIQQLKPKQQQVDALNILPQLLSKQWIKRRILQQKCKLLQNHIKKSQKMVLAICKYGSETQKKAHISKLCKIRQNLFNIFKVQSLFRKQIQEREKQKDLLEDTIKIQKNQNKEYQDIFY